MRTSIDIPDQLFKKMKTRAIEEEVTMKEFLLQILHRELEVDKNPVKEENLKRKELKTRKKKKEYKDSKINKLREELSI